jgi:hypothetical protein
MGVGGWRDWGGWGWGGEGGMSRRRARCRTGQIDNQSAAFTGHSGGRAISG